jgi:large repetitive protein
VRRYTARDDAGNENKCTFVVTVVDDEIPQITCPADITVTVDHNSDGGTAYFTLPVLGDNSDSIVTVSCDHNSGDSSYKIGQTMVICTAHDTAGNKDVCSFVVTVVDNEPPALTCPPPVVVYTELNLATAVATWDLPVRTDNSNGVVQLDVSIAPGSRFPLGVTAVKYTGEDPSRNKNTCEFSVTVIDKQSPNIFCPADLVVSTDPRVATAAVVWALPVTWDNTMGPVALEGTHRPGARFAIGRTAVRYTAADATGNTNFCTFQITVVDVESPLITCPADIVVDTNLGTASGTVRWLVPQVAQTVTDNSNLNVVVTGNAASGALFPIGMTFVTYTAVDLAGNAASCSFRITVQDREAPRMLCPADVNTVTDAGLNTGRVSWRVPKASDNSQQHVFMRASATAALTAFPVGTTTVSYFANDVFGNNATCTFLVRVRDQEAPRIACPASQVITTLQNRTTGAATWIVPNATDNLPGQIAVQSNRLPGDASFPMGLSVVRYIATDTSGNVNTCAFTVTVLDVQAPRLLLCPASISIGNDKGMPSGR